MSIADFLLYVLAGAGVGLAVGLSGIGGGSLMTPLLMLFGFPPHVAVGTDLLYAAFTKCSGIYSHQKQRHIDWKITWRLAAGSVPAAIVTVLILNHYFSGASDYADLITSTLGIMLIVTAAILIFKTPLQRFTRRHDQVLDRHVALVTLLAGLILGICVTLSSVGAGVFGTAVLMLLYPALSPGRIVGTDIAHAVPLTLVAGSGHLLLGNVDFGLLAALLVGSIPAIHVGATLSRHLPEKLLRGLLTALLLSMGIRYAFF